MSFNIPCINRIVNNQRRDIQRPIGLARKDTLDAGNFLPDRGQMTFFFVQLARYGRVASSVNFCSKASSSLVLLVRYAKNNAQQNDARTKG